MWVFTRIHHSVCYMSMCYHCCCCFFYRRWYSNLACRHKREECTIVSLLLPSHIHQTYMFSTGSKIACQNIVAISIINAWATRSSKELQEQNDEHCAERVEKKTQHNWTDTINVTKYIYVSSTKNNCCVWTRFACSRFVFFPSFLCPCVLTATQIMRWPGQIFTAKIINNEKSPRKTAESQT